MQLAAAIARCTLKIHNAKDSGEWRMAAFRSRFAQALENFKTVSHFDLFFSNGWLKEPPGSARVTQ